MFQKFHFVSVSVAVCASDSNFALVLNCSYSSSFKKTSQGKKMRIREKKEKAEYITILD